MDVSDKIYSPVALHPRKSFNMFNEYKPVKLKQTLYRSGQALRVPEG